MIRGAVVIMAKAPREGSVKTRLAGAHPPRDVVRLSECMLLDTLALAQALPRVHVAVLCPSGDVADLSARLPAGVSVAGQRGHGLAAALDSVFDRFVPLFRRVVAVDSDSPHLPLAILEAAFELLEGHDLVVGPTEDGGYYLVGASAAHPGLFDPAPLGTGNARDALLANARAAGLSVAFTDSWYDVDVPADLRRLAAELRDQPARAPRTAALVASWFADRDEELAG
jgi:rSAM/selenodomain-associated transferase 1